MYRWFAVVLVAVLACGCGHGSRAASGSDGAATVVRIIDGDTIVAKVDDTEEHVRLIGIDTPKPRKTSLRAKSGSPSPPPHDSNVRGPI
jgi:endonuclease YncB( thermonuclease family)